MLQPGDNYGTLCPGGYRAGSTSASCPSGEACIAVQFVARRLFPSPSYRILNGQCLPEARSHQNQALTNIYRYDPSANTGTGERNDETFYLAPGQSGLITLRVYGEVGQQFFNNWFGAPGNVEGVTLKVTPQAANCSACVGGECGTSDNVGETTECQPNATEIFDRIPPVLTLPGDITSIEATGPAGAVVIFPASAVDDLDGPLAPTCAPASGSTFALGTTTVNCSVTDLHGNTTTGSFTVLVVDTTAPSLTVPANQTLEASGSAGAVAMFDATASDIADPSVTVACTPTSGSMFALGVTTVMCTATDDRGNSTTGAFTVTVQDTTAPNLTVPASQILEASGPAGAVATFDATASDIADPSVTIVCTPTSGSTFALGVTTVTCMATDDSGNSTSGTFTVTVQDTTAPVLTGVPGNQTKEATSAAGAVASWTNPSATDAVDASPTVGCAPASGSTFALGPTTVTCTATDAAGNAATPTTFTVTVVDTTAPVLTVPANQTAEATSAAGAVVTYTTPTANDTVAGPVAVECAPGSGSQFPIANTTVTCSASDTQVPPNTATVSFTVTVRDTTPPVVAAHTDVTAEATGATGAIVSYTAPNWTDAVSGNGTASCAPASESLFALGNTTVTCNASDGAGNPALATTFVVHVADTTAPVLTVPANISDVQATSAAGATVAFSASATDTVDASPTVGCAPASGSTFAIGTTTVTCTATDDFGNATTATFAVTVVDTIAPSSITVTSFSPKLLWPPDGRIVNVTVNGEAFDAGSGVARIKWAVIDEYNTYQPTGFVDVPGNGPFTVVVPLLADRRGNDKDGRHYTIRLTAVDRRGNELTQPPAQAPVVKVHDQSSK